MIENVEELYLPSGEINFRKLARLITRIENDPAFAEDQLSRIYRENPDIQILGITGPPGAGKSSLTDRIIQKYREQGKRVAVVAVDPSSPFTGGAILGDRIRMGSHSTDPGVFIRSMGSRGNLGGMAPATVDVLNLFKTVGFDVVIIETVGVGQSEVDVMSIADTVLLTLVPGLGDDIQALKAGIMEIADIFVINKADKDGKDRLLAEINMIINLNRHRLEWIPPVVETVAIEGLGLDDLIDEVEGRNSYIAENFKGLKEKKLMSQFRHMVEEKVGGNILAIFKKRGIFTDWTTRVLEGSINPYTAIKELDNRLSINWED